MSSIETKCMVQKGKFNVGKIKEGFTGESGVELVLTSWRKRMVMSRDNINKDTDAETVVWTSPSGNGQSD